MTLPANLANIGEEDEDEDEYEEQPTVTLDLAAMRAVRKRTNVGDNSNNSSIRSNSSHASKGKENEGICHVSSAPYWQYI